MADFSFIGRPRHCVLDHAEFTQKLMEAGGLLCSHSVLENQFDFDET